MAASFYVCRFADETLIHRADATLALGREFTVPGDVAADALGEWMELGSLPMLFDIRPEQRELLGPGRTVHLHATDTSAEWLIELAGDAIAWRRAHEKAVGRAAACLFAGGVRSAGWRSSVTRSCWAFCWGASVLG
ncbi:hypothetical protein [Actinomadura sp. GTD37]|uniref:hypothetical protein n=1 Tax=Actinomadura sp. GTD37 TaxID=1778030 RepID=UPI0035BF9D06